MNNHVILEFYDFQYKKNKKIILCGLSHHQILIENEKKRTNLCKIIKIKDEYGKK